MLSPHIQSFDLETVSVLCMVLQFKSQTLSFFIVKPNLCAMYCTMHCHLTSSVGTCSILEHLPSWLSFEIINFQHSTFTLKCMNLHSCKIRVLVRARLQISHRKQKTNCKYIQLEDETKEKR